MINGGVLRSCFYKLCILFYRNFRPIIIFRLCVFLEIVIMQLQDINMIVVQKSIDDALNVEPLRE